MGKMREEFEEWAIEHHFSTTKKLDGKSYAHDSTMCAFEGWKASRAALCVELPDNLTGEYYADGWNACLEFVEGILEGVGVPYK